MVDPFASGSRHVRGRRSTLGGLAVAGILARPASAPSRPVAPPRAGAPVRFAYVGCRTTRERDARGQGIQVLRMGPATNGWTHVRLVRDLNENSGTVVPFRVDARTGHLSRFGGVIRTGSPVCTVFSTI